MKTTKVTAPWGWYEILSKDKYHWVKKLVIFPGAKTSLQYHKYRDENWYVLKGTGRLVYQCEENKLSVGNRWVIPSHTIHRIINDSISNDLVIIEIATGNPKETDIVRLEDIYGRQTSGI